MDVVSSFDLADGGSRHVIHSIRSDSDSFRILWLRLISTRDAAVSAGLYESPVGTDGRNLQSLSSLL